MQPNLESAQSASALQRRPALAPWQVTALALGTAFFGVVAAIHAISATAASSIPLLGLMWIFVPAPAVFLWLMLGSHIGKSQSSPAEEVTPRPLWQRENFWRSLARGYLSLAAIFSVLVLAGAGWIGAQRAIHPNPCSDAPALAKYPELESAAETVSFQVPEGNQRVGWFIPGRGQATVLLLHGYGCQRQEMLEYADVLHRAGYSTMLFDFRNRGDSDGDAVTLGFYETQDAVAAVEYLKTRHDVDINRLGVLGASMGASVAIMAAAQVPEIKAAIADSPFQSANKAVEEGFTRVTDLPAFPFAPVTLLIIRFRLGISPGDVVPEDQISAISPRPILLIHGLADTKVTPGNSEALFAAAGEPKELWLLPGSEHTDGIKKDYQDEYSQRMVEFFDRYLK